MRDIYRLTLVHIAPASENAHALCALLSVDPQVIPGDLKGKKNQDGITPLEGLESSMRSMREPTETLVGVWRGYLVFVEKGRWGCR